MMSYIIAVFLMGFFCGGATVSFMELILDED